MRIYALCLVVSSALGIACGHESPPPAVAQSTTLDHGKSGATKTGAGTDDSKARADLAVGTDVKAACGIRAEDVKPKATLKDTKFDFDSSDLTPEERGVLDEVARCLTSGALKGRAVALVGHADPRGEAEYNMGLGAYRATAVKQYLGTLGVDDHRMKETSRGAIDALGVDEEGWRIDRRVDITLAN